MSETRIATSGSESAGIGTMPDQWHSKRLSYCVWRSDVKVESSEIGACPYVGLEHVVPHTGQLFELDDTTPEGTANVFSADDVLFGKLRPYLGKALRPEFGGVCSTEFLVLRPREFTREFLLYVLLSDEFISAVDSSTYGAKMPRANWEFIGDIRVPVPPLEVQATVSRYLDRETARIDELILKQELLIERLKEYRTALITYVVTKGVPDESNTHTHTHTHTHTQHRLKNLFRFSSGQFLTAEKISESDAIPVYGANGVRGYTDTSTHMGPVLVTGRVGTCGKVFLEKGVLWASNNALVMHPSKDLDLRWAKYALENLNLERYTASTAQPALHMDTVKDLKVSVPDVKKQAQISDYLDEKTSAIDTLQGNTKMAIARLQEYRASVITRAVTKGLI